MANPQTMTNSVREYATELHTALNRVNGIVALINDLGGQAFFQAYLEGGGEPDLTWDEFVAFFTTLQSMQTWIGNNAADFAPMRKR